jgi:hypothetical protein
MGLWGKSTFVAVAWLCGSACNIYHGDSLKNERHSEQPATAAPDPREFRNFEFIGIHSPTTTINPRRDNDNDIDSGGAAEQKHEPPVAGRQSPSEPQSADRQHEEPKDEEDAGIMHDRSSPPTALVDAGARHLDVGKPQKIETGRPHPVDAGVVHPVAKASAACRGERGYESDARCYFVLDTPVSWNVGRDHCYEHDAHLASITSAHESELIASFDLQLDVWIGFSRFGAANFSWLTNESGSFSNWQKGAPRPMQESGALILASTGLWTNRNVSELHPTLCETERKAKAQ